MSVYIIKLISGLELITEITNETVIDNVFDSVLHLKRPLRFGNIGNSTEGQQQIGFFSYLVGEPEPDLVFLNGAIIESYLKESQIDEALVKEYKSRTTIIQTL